jgi:hypothetical protein
MKKLSLTLAALALSVLTFAQYAPTYEIHYFPIESISTDQFTIDFSGQHSQEAFSQFKMKVTNKTKDYLIIKPEEIVFEFSHGKYSAKDKTIIIAPYKSSNNTIRVTGGAKTFHEDEVKITVNGFYLVPVDGKVHNAPNFKLPASTNSFNAGPFACKVDGDIVKVTKETIANFKCTYNGSKVALIDESNAGVFVTSARGGTWNSEQIFANKGASGGTSGLKALMGGTDLIFPGETKSVSTKFQIPGKTADMQFANMEIDWKNTFVETSQTVIKVPNNVLNLKKDEGMTQGKNK